MLKNDLFLKLNSVNILNIHLSSANKSTNLILYNYVRWFDKSFSLIFTADGEVALNFEHAWGDGVAVMSYVNELTKDLENRPSIHPDSRPASIDASQHVRRLGRYDLGGREGAGGEINVSVNPGVSCLGFPPLVG